MLLGLDHGWPTWPAVAVGGILPRPQPVHAVPRLVRALDHGDRDYRPAHHPQARLHPPRHRRDAHGEGRERRREPVAHRPHARLWRRHRSRHGCRIGDAPPDRCAARFPQPRQDPRATPPPPTPDDGCPNNDVTTNQDETLAMPAQTSPRANWNYPTAIRFGAGRIAELPEVCRAAGITRPLFVTDAGLAKLPASPPTPSRCSGTRACPQAVFSDVQPNPVEANLAGGRRRLPGRRPRRRHRLRRRLGLDIGEAHRLHGRADAAGMGLRGHRRLVDARRPRRHRADRRRADHRRHRLRSRPRRRAHQRDDRTPRRSSSTRR